LYKGFSFWFANNFAHEIGLNLRFYGFDSFEGLPKSNVDIHRNWKEGSYSASIEDVNASLNKWGMQLPYSLIKGWYSKKLFEKMQREQPFDNPIIVVIDCDLYESAIEVLNFIHPKMSIGLILLFDDWNAFSGDENHGERRAVKEYENNNPSFKKSSLFSFGTYGEAFEVVNI
jgi:O-methyltransferase